MSLEFLPVSRADMERQHIRQLDFVYVVGDAYVDHPSFGHAIIGRLLQSRGYTVGIISQPDWEESGEYYGTGRAAPGFSCDSRKYGLYGESLYGIKKTQTDGCLHAGRCYGKTAGSGGDGLLQPDQDGV